MATYKVTGINVGSFNLGESDKVLTIFTAERGLVRAVAKGARKPGTKMVGRADPLNVNKLLIARGKTLDIITQAETIQTFPRLREDLTRLTYALYYAELSREFGPGLIEESNEYFQYLVRSLRLIAESTTDPHLLSLSFALGLMEMLGYKPELSFCVICRQNLSDFRLGAFHNEWGGVACRNCLEGMRAQAVAEPTSSWETGSGNPREATEITPLVWKFLVLAANPDLASYRAPLPRQPLAAAHRLIERYIEYRAGRRMRALDLLRDISST